MEEDDTICLQCGDRGFTNALIYCVRCLQFAVHRYCLSVVPNSSDKFVRWACDDCEEKVHGFRKCHGSSSGRDSQVLEDIGNDTKKNDETNRDEPYRDVPKQPYATRSMLDSVECDESANQCTLMQLEWYNDDQKRSSPQLEEKNLKANRQTKTIKKKRLRKRKKRKVVHAMKKDRHKFVRTSSKQSDEEDMAVDTNMNARSATDSILPCEAKEVKLSEQRDDKMCISGQPFTSDTDPVSVVHPAIPSDGPARNSNNETVELSKLILENKGFDLKNVSAQLCTKERKIGLSNDCPNNGEPEDTEVRTSSTHHLSTFFRDNPNGLDVAVAAPVVMPIWRGFFSILDTEEDSLEEVVAHASSKACPKVYEAASQFQPMLQFEMFPKSEIWPKNFEKSEPGGDNIALYFFPSKISEQGYDILVEKMMENELGLKAVVQNADLLIFTSNVLPLRYWRFQGKYYIWGVFRGKKTTPSPLQSSNGKVADISPINGGSRLTPLGKSSSCSSAC